MENEHIYKLVICLDRKGNKSIILEQGPIYKIDTLTSPFNNAKELRAYYSEQIELFEKQYQKDINYLENKYNKKELGDITIIDPEKISVTDIPRESIVYKENIEMFEIAIDDLQFVQFLKNADYSKYCAIQRYNKEIDEQHKNIIDETISWLIRKMPKIYDEYAIKYNKPPLKTIYKHMKKEKQLLNKYKEMIEKQTDETANIEQLEAYELNYQQDRRDYLKYDLNGYKEEKGRRKVKKIGGGI